MSRSTPPQRAPEGADEATILSALLASELPGRHEQLRPARLRSASQQRAVALHGFKFRTWVDRALGIAERALVFAALLAFVYWLANGYGRDWLYALGEARAAPAVATATPTLYAALAQYSTAEIGAALPFTRPEEALDAAPAPSIKPEEPQDVVPAPSAPRDAFMAPQPMRGAVDQADPRPLRMSIPVLSAEMRVDEVFLVDSEWEVAEYAAGYHHGSALPGLVGNSVISGHAGLRGAVFKDLGRLKPGHEVIVETATWRYTYRVRSLVSVWPNQVEVMAPTATPVLTLITCTNWDTQRLVVFADLADARPL